MTLSSAGITNFALAQAGLPAGVLTAAGEPVEITISADESVSAAELGVENPGILPSNPFYFFKELGRTIQRVFTFNPTSRVTLELDIANTKLAELKKVEEVSGDDHEAILDAVENYQAAQARLKARLEALRETSKNPEVDKLLSKLAERTIQHEKVFDELITRFDDSQEIKDIAEDAKGNIEEGIAAAADKEDPSNLVAKFEQALLEGEGGELKHIRSLEIIDRIQRKSSEDVREAFEKLRHGLGEQLEKDLNDVLDKDGVEGVGEAIEGLPGDYVRRSVILQEIREQADRRVSEAIRKISSSYEALIKGEEDLTQRAKEQMDRAAKVIEEAKKLLAERKDTTGVAASLLKEAEAHLREAGSALTNGKAGEAFGQARSAEVLARNAIRLLGEKNTTDTGELEKIFAEFDLRIKKYEMLLIDRKMTQENNPKAYALLDQAKQHLQYARDAFAKKDLAGANLHIGHVKGFLQDLARMIEGALRPAVEQKTIEPRTSDACEKILSEMRRLKELVISNLLSEKDYQIKSEALNKAYQECLGVKTPVMAPTPKPAPTIDPIIMPLEIEPIKPTSTTEPSIREFKIEADDAGFYPSSVLTVPRGAKVRITFIIRRENVYPAGLEVRSSKFKTGGLAPGQIGTVEFLADESFEFGSWWPASNVFKAGGKVVVQ
ncbi:MAG: hypothetical protein G01um10143_626 [Parcubacteria group bacterium Gr01-1014_3]|nr:MAG: hypothetical protein G01um10143_626 [Parcubacteria group bacterium Gr01-1014_3]